MADTPLINEASRRWDDFPGGRWVDLPDGQRWAFYEPQAVLRDGRPGWTFGGAPDVDAILSSRFGRVLAKRSKATTDEDRASATLEAAWFLLARNYSVTPEEFEALLAPMAAWDDERQAAILAELLYVVGMAVARAAGLAEVA
jgi:hypothetical protein